MSCGSCGNRGKAEKTTFLAKFSDGSVKVFNTEIEAKAAVTRRGGSYRPNTKK